MIISSKNFGFEHEHFNHAGAFAFMVFCNFKT